MKFNLFEIFSTGNKKSLKTLNIIIFLINFHYEKTEFYFNSFKRLITYQFDNFHQSIDFILISIIGNMSETH